MSRIAKYILTIVLAHVFVAGVLLLLEPAYWLKALGVVFIAVSLPLGNRLWKAPRREDTASPP
jgi:hypothetical protein